MLKLRLRRLPTAISKDSGLNSDLFLIEGLLVPGGDRSSAASAIN